MAQDGTPHVISVHFDEKFPTETKKKNHINVLKKIKDCVFHFVKVEKLKG